MMVTLVNRNCCGDECCVLMVYDGVLCVVAAVMIVCGCVDDVVCL